MYGQGVSLFSPVPGALPPGPPLAERAPLWRRLLYGLVATVVLAVLALIEIEGPGGVDDSGARLLLGLAPAAAAPLVLHHHRVAVTGNLRSVVESATIVLATGIISYAVAGAIDASDPADAAGAAALLLGISLLVWFAGVPWAADRIGHRFEWAVELPGRFVLAAGRWLLTVLVLLAVVLAVDRALEDMEVPIGTVRAGTTLIAAVATAMLVSLGAEALQQNQIDHRQHWPHRAGGTSQGKPEMSDRSYQRPPVSAATTPRARADWVRRGVEKGRGARLACQHESRRQSALYAR